MDGRGIPCYLQVKGDFFEIKRTKTAIVEGQVSVISICWYVRLPGLDLGST